MTREPSRDAEVRSYSEVLGEYYHVAVEISDRLEEIGRSHAEQDAKLRRLEARERELKEQLNRIEKKLDSSDFETVLDRAIP